MPKTANSGPQRGLQRLEGALGRLAARRAFQMLLARDVLTFGVKFLLATERAPARGGAAPAAPEPQGVAP